MEKQKHSFGTPVSCAVCGQEVGSVWATSYEEAVNGRGLCDDCKAKLDAEDSGKQTNAPDVEGDSHASG